MKIGEMEIPDGTIEDLLSKQGKKIVDGSDYQKKAEAAADLAKFRKVTGENRSVEDIEKIIKSFEEAERKNKTELELFKQEVEKSKAVMAQRDQELNNLKMEIRTRDVKRFFDEAQKSLNIFVIDAILEPFRKEFYSMDEAKVSQDELKNMVTNALVKAQELQKGELDRLGLTGNSPKLEPNAPSFGGGITTVPSTGGVPLTNSQWDIMRKGAASPAGVPLGPNPQQK